MNATDTTGCEPRSLAARLVYRVAERGESLADRLATQLRTLDDPRQRALAQELCFGTLRWYHRLDAVAAQLLRKPLRQKDRDVHALLLVGLYQLLVLRMPAHAAVSETVAAARHLGKNWAAGMVNGVLRNAQRRSTDLLAAADQAPSSCWSHPDWWIDILREDWPEHWQQILAADNRQAPMSLRVNLARTARDAYLARLEQAGLPATVAPVPDSALILRQPVGVDRLPGFAEGMVSVQDAAAQLCAFLIDLQPGHRVLDACAAPGGKTSHMLEMQPGIGAMYAVDNDQQRLARVTENLQRLHLRAELVAADAGEPASWWDKRPFDRILLDAPCSASGVVRRHPDIKLLRRRRDLDDLVLRQQRLLDALWPLLAPGGMLLYATCSVFRMENSDNIQVFRARHTDAGDLPIAADWGLAQAAGRQVLPGVADMDGFYFARLVKRR
jgi:16S rRNA (cytosine967-C5)-methyltransferase